MGTGPVLFMYSFSYHFTSPQDMLDTDVPDKFSVITYVSQFYHLLKDEDNSKSPSLAMLSPSLSPSFDDSSDLSDLESPLATPKGTPKSLPRSLFISNNPILRNNKFSPHNQENKYREIQDKVIESDSEEVIKQQKSEEKVQRKPVR